MPSYIAKLVAAGLKAAAGPLQGTYVPATLIKVSQGARTPSSLATGRTPIVTSYAAKGFVTSWKYATLGGTLVSEGDRIVVLIGPEIQGGQVPEQDDRVTIDGITSEILAIDRDAAGATFTLLVKDRA